MTIPILVAVVALQVPVFQFLMGRHAFFVTDMTFGVKELPELTGGASAAWARPAIWALVAFLLVLFGVFVRQAAAVRGRESATARQTPKPLNPQIARTRLIVESKIPFSIRNPGGPDVSGSPG